MGFNKRKNKDSRNLKKIKKKNGSQSHSGAFE